jgi:hypothetical protein
MVGGEKNIDYISFVPIFSKKKNQEVLDFVLAKLISNTGSAD